MSKPKDDWFYTVVGIVRNYPERKREYTELHEQSMSAEITGMPRGSGTTRTTEMFAIREMAPMKQKEFEAVRAAVEVTKRLPNGEIRIELIRRVYWQNGKSTLKAVYPQLHIAQATAERWHGAFIRLVGEFLGYIV